MTVQDTVFVLTSLYLITGIVVLAELDITLGSVRQHYQNVARTDPEMATLMREYPLRCAACHVLVYLIGLVPWPLAVWALARRREEGP
ncbi:hypothetical protein [Streptomyces leeuwenhoekii]|uniref:Sle1_078 protein n=1 Tax=Streptomyces leeuwenhoekii TaxID=1437453 RepID=A0A0F7VL16_STRLW|nr:hypothetical protein [Streptomyces leeuwenhoekii]CQR59245.1 sle1_078 [Streptomyces leeuwenhoekii]